MKEHIDRAAALQAIDMNISNLRAVAGESAMLNKAIDLVQYTRDFIANVPAADVVEHKRGRWLFYCAQDCIHAAYVCSECNKGCKNTIEHKFNFCPNCGADMREG